MEESIVVRGTGSPALEGRLGLVDRPRAGLVLCHPHPLYGGDMDNPVVVRCAEVAREEGIATLRFNFRGVGGSEGTHDEGRGEMDDVGHALAVLKARLAGQPLGLLGYSFGAWVVAQLVTERHPVGAMSLVAPPLALRPLPPVDAATAHILVVAGTSDTYCPLADLDQLARNQPGLQVERIAEADHFFFGKLYPLGEVVRSWARRWAGPTGAAGEAASPSRPTG
jgi:alpha/beta superfamily hydrolase